MQVTKFYTLLVQLPSPSTGIKLCKRDYHFTSGTNYFTKQRLYVALRQRLESISQIVTLELMQVLGGLVSHAYIT